MISGDTTDLPGPRYFILRPNETTPVECDYELWVQWRHSLRGALPVVGYSALSNYLLVITLFHGEELRREIDRPPLIFKTAAFGEPHFTPPVFSPTWEIARLAHKQMVDGLLYYQCVNLGPHK